MKLKEQLEQLEGISLSVPIANVEKDHIKLYVQADANDADYVSEEFEIDVNKILELIPIIDLIINKREERRINWNTNNWTDRESYLTKEQIETFEPFVPFVSYDEYESVHTIEDIKLSLMLKSGEVYDINYKL